MVHDDSMQPTDLIGTADAARILNCSHRTVHRMVEDGTLTPAHIASGGRAGIFLFRRTDIDKVAEARAKALAS